MIILAFRYSSCTFLVYYMYGQQFTHEKRAINRDWKKEEKNFRIDMIEKHDGLRNEWWWWCVHLSIYAHVVIFSICWSTHTHCCNENFYIWTCTVCCLNKTTYIMPCLTYVLEYSSEHTFQANDDHGCKQEWKKRERATIHKKTCCSKNRDKQNIRTHTHSHTLAFCFHFVVVVLQFSMLCSWHFRIGNVSGNSSLYTHWFLLGSVTLTI